MIRQPAVAGQFYPADPETLKNVLSRCMGPRKQGLEALGILVPHAGYIYSGSVAGVTYSSLLLPRTVVILCPNHTGAGAPIAIMSEGAWQTPLGLAQINAPLARLIKEASDLFVEDDVAHQNEHSLEVQLPFLQFLIPDFSFVPINIGTTALSSLKSVGSAIAQAISNYDDKVLLIASSDMTHYESAAKAHHKDQLAIDRILNLDPEGLYDKVTSERITMCGYAPTVCVLEACRLRGAKTATLVKYADSGDVNGDKSKVVAYAGIIIR